MADAELYHADHGTYPQRLSDTLSTQYASSSIPVAPTPADGSCTSAQNTYQYELIDAAYYQFTFCTGSSVGGYAAGVHTMTEQGIDVGYQ
jgi:hypothetical protein